MPISKFYDEYTSENWQASKETPITDLPRTEYLKAYYLEMKGTITTTATAPTKHEDGVLNLLQDILLDVKSGLNVMNGRLAKITGFDLYVLNYILNGVEPEFVDVGVAASTEYAFRALLELPFTMFPNDKIHLFPTPKATKIDLTPKWGTYSDVYTANAPSSWTTTPSLTVFQHGKVTPVTDNPYIRMIQTYEKTISAAGRIKQAIDNGWDVELILMKSIDNSVRDDDILNDVQLTENTKNDHISPIDWEDLQAIVAKQLGIGGITEPDGATHNRLVTGYGVMDFRDDPIITRGLDALEVIADANTPSGTAKLYNVVVYRKNLL